MIENLIVMVRMICFSYELSKESGYKLEIENSVGLSPAEAMKQLFADPLSTKVGVVMGALWVLFGIFVVLAELIRRDGIKEGVATKACLVHRVVLCWILNRSLACNHHTSHLGGSNGVDHRWFIDRRSFDLHGHTNREEVMGVFDRIKDLQDADALQIAAKFRYQNDMEFRVVVDYAVRCSIPRFVRDQDNRALVDALEEQGVASASMALIFFEMAFKEK